MHVTAHLPRKVRRRSIAHKSPASFLATVLNAAPAQDSVSDASKVGGEKDLYTFLAGLGGADGRWRAGEAIRVHRTRLWNADSGGIPVCQALRINTAAKGSMLYVALIIQSQGLKGVPRRKHIVQTLHRPLPIEGWPDSTSAPAPDWSFL